MTEEMKVPEGFAIVPLIPSREMLWCIANSEWPEDWERGKRAQSATSWGVIPAKTELECAYGQYERMLEECGTEAHSNIFQSYAKENQALRNVLFKVREVLQKPSLLDPKALIDLINEGLKTARDEPQI